MGQVSKKLVTVKLVDGTSPTPRELEIKIGEGDVSFTEHHAREYTLDRGELDTVRNGDDEPMDVSFDFTWEYLAGYAVDTAHPAGNGTVREFLMRQGIYSTNSTSATGDTCAPYAVDVVLEYAPSCTGATFLPNETITLPDFRVEEFNMKLADGQVSCSGKCNAVEPIITRSAAST